MFHFQFIIPDTHEVLYIAPKGATKAREDRCKFTTIAAALNYKRENKIVNQWSLAKARSPLRNQS